MYKGNRELNKFLENLNWSSAEFDSIYADELAGFVPSLDSHSASCSSDNDSNNNTNNKNVMPKLSLNDNLGIADTLQSQQYQTINNLAMRNMIEGDSSGYNNNNGDNPVGLTQQLLGLYATQQNEEENIKLGVQRELHGSNHNDDNRMFTHSLSTVSTSSSIIPPVNNDNAATTAISNHSSSHSHGHPHPLSSHTSSILPSTSASRGLKRPVEAVSSSSDMNLYDNRGINESFSNFPDVSKFNAQHFAPPASILEMEDDDDFDEIDAPNNSTDDKSVMTPKERRRERNKVLARKTRMKKKAELETLRNQVKELSNENRQLKMARYVLTLELLGNHRVPDNIRQRIQESPSSSLSDSTFALNSIFNDNAMKSVAELLSKSQRSFCITNHNLPDQPIIYASPLFLDLTGYSAEEAVGRNCRFLQGRETNREDVMKIRAAIKAGHECHVALLNYRKNGSKFWNSIHLSPMKAANGEVLLYVGIQVEVTAEKAVQVNSKTNAGIDVDNGNNLTSSSGTDRASEVSWGTEDCFSTADNTSIPMLE